MSPAPIPKEPLAFDAADLPRRDDAPRLSQARGVLLRQVEIVDEEGVREHIDIPVERALTVFVDRKELVTLMTLGAAPELMVLGYLLNQGLIVHAAEVESIDVDWEVEAAAVRTRAGVDDLAGKTAHRVVTTGCGQGTVFGDMMAQIDAVALPSAQAARIAYSTLVAILDQMRRRYSVHRQAGSVHGCALYEGTHMLVFAEDVGRHNALDTIAGWMAVHGVAGGDKVFYTTGRLTSEMVMKAARMGVPIVVSRNGVTAMGHELATRLGMTLFGRAGPRRFLCYSGFERYDAQPDVARDRAVEVLSAD